MFDLNGSLLHLNGWMFDLNGSILHLNGYKHFESFHVDPEFRDNSYDEKHDVGTD